MTENMKKYLELISRDEEAQKKLNEQKSSSIQEAKERIIADAAEKGITLTEEDFAANAETGELSDDELEAVAGGKECVCVIGGGGTATSEIYEDTCACVLAGAGRGYGYVSNWETNLSGDKELDKVLTGMERCVCAVGGYGDAVGKDL